jgi:hypothetical protein
MSSFPKKIKTAAKFKNTILQSKEMLLIESLIIPFEEVG